MADTSPFPAGDPRNAAYYENIAALKHAEETTLARGGEERARATAAATYNEGQLSKAEPLSYRANQYRANNEGLLESGVNAGRRGGIATNYAGKRFAVARGLKETTERIARGEAAAKEARATGEARAATNASIEGKRYLEEHPNTAAQPGGGVVSTGWQGQPGARYRVGPGTIKWSRDPATRRLQELRGY